MPRDPDHASDHDADDWEDLAGAEAYAEAAASGTLYRTLSRRLIDLLAPPPGALILDLACGTSIAAAPLAARLGPTGRVLGIDLSQAMLAVAQHAVPRQVASFVRARLAALPLRDGVADGALCSAALWHVPERGALFAELARVLAAGARLAFNIPAAQLIGCEVGPPPPLIVALTSAGERLFGSPPAPGGPLLRRDQIVSALPAAGFELGLERWCDLTVAQAELIDLLAVPAIAARAYPERSPAARQEWIDAARRDVDPEELVAVRWWELCARRTLTR